MPELLDNAIGKIQKTGKTKEEATKIAIATFQRAGLMKPKSMQLTKAGEERQKMSEKERDLSRKVKFGNHRPSHYKWDDKKGWILKNMYKGYV